MGEGCRSSSGSVGFDGSENRYNPQRRTGYGGAGPEFPRGAGGSPAFSPSRRAACTTGSPRVRYAQKLLRTSPPARVARAHQILGAMLLLTKRADPSPNKILTPPECRLRAAACPGLCEALLQSQRESLGSSQWL